MNYRILGRTGLKVSEIGLGGEWFNGLTAEESTAIVDAAQEHGINYIDIFMPQAPTRAGTPGSVYHSGTSLHHL